MRSLLVVMWCGGQVLTWMLWCVLRLGLRSSVATLIEMYTGSGSRLGV